MQVENHKEEVPFEYYAELFSKADAQEMAQRTGTNFDGEKFYVNLLGVEYAISYPTAAFTPGAALPVQTFIVQKKNLLLILAKLSLLELALQPKFQLEQLV